eukprot:PhM_4_TR4464/c0_g1_i1/m.92806
MTTALSSTLPAAASSSSLSSKNMKMLLVNSLKMSRTIFMTSPFYRQNNNNLSMRDITFVCPTIPDPSNNEKSASCFEFVQQNMARYGWMAAKATTITTNTMSEQQQHLIIVGFRTPEHFIEEERDSFLLSATPRQSMMLLLPNNNNNNNNNQVIEKHIQKFA